MPNKTRWTCSILTFLSLFVYMVGMNPGMNMYETKFIGSNNLSIANLNFSGTQGVTKVLWSIWNACIFIPYDDGRNTIVCTKMHWIDKPYTFTIENANKPHARRATVKKAWLQGLFFQFPGSIIILWTFLVVVYCTIEIDMSRGWHEVKCYICIIMTFTISSLLVALITIVTNSVVLHNIRTELQLLEVPSTTNPVEGFITSVIGAGFIFFIFFYVCFASIAYFHKADEIIWAPGNPPTANALNTYRTQAATNRNASLVANNNNRATRAQNRRNTNWPQFHALQWGWGKVWSLSKIFAEVAKDFLLGHLQTFLACVRELLFVFIIFFHDYTLWDS